MRKGWTGNTRAPWHDYTQRQIYHITLKKLPEVLPFGSLAGDWRLPAGTYGRSYIKASPLGSVIKSCLKAISSIHPALKIYQYALMPDHLHLLLSVEAPLDEILGRKLAAFKVTVNNRAGLEAIFEKGFNDQILTTSRQLDVIYSYLRDNPYRLAVRQAHPDFFTRRHSLIIGDTHCRLYGNIHLLDNPFKDRVIVHRADDDRTFQSNRERWLHTAANGGVLVSPFISPREKSVRKDAESAGGKIILITNRPFGEKEKPSGRDFDLCAEGRLLIIAPSEAIPIDRPSCLKMNSLGASLAGE